MAKIAFKLERNEDGFPPIAVELLNATALSEDTFQIRNAPFFAPNVSYGDVVRARSTEVEGQYDFVELIEGSPFTSISVILLDAGMDTFLMDLFRGLGCVIEYGEFGVYRVLGVAIPAEADYPALQRQLSELEEGSKISFAELSLADK